MIDKYINQPMVQWPPADYKPAKRYNSIEEWRKDHPLTDEEVRAFGDKIEKWKKEHPNESVRFSRDYREPDKISHEEEKLTTAGFL